MQPLHITLIAVIVAFYTAYLTKQLLLKRQGIQGNRLGKGTKPKRTQRLEVALAVGTFTMPLAQIGSLAWSATHSPSVVPWYSWAGVAVAAAGTVLFTLAVVTMRGSWRAGVDASQHTQLVTSGIYRLSRNPAFAGFDLFYLGTTLAVPNPVLGMLTAALVVLFHLQIRNEETFLLATFGSPYARYLKAVRRYL